VLLFGYYGGVPPTPDILQHFDCNIFPGLEVYNEKSGKTKVALTYTKPLPPPGTKHIDKVRCVACHESVPSFEIVSVGSSEKGYRELCSRCFNTEMAQLGGLNGFEHVDLKPVTLTDAAGKQHEFHLGAATLEPRLRARLKSIVILPAGVP
jgi:hypothetical protein